MRHAVWCLLVVGLVCGLLGLMSFAQDARADGILFAGSDVEEFAQVLADTSDRIGKFPTVGAVAGAGAILVVPYHVNGMTVVQGELLTGTVGTPHTTAADAQTLRTVDLNGVEQSSATADLLTKAQLSPVLHPFKTCPVPPIGSFFHQ